MKRNSHIVRSVKREKGQSESIRAVTRRLGIPRGTFYRNVKRYQQDLKAERLHRDSERRVALRVAVAAASRRPWTVSMVREAMHARGYKTGRRQAWELLTTWTEKWKKSGLGYFDPDKSSETVLRFINQWRRLWKGREIDPGWDEPDNDIHDDKFTFASQKMDRLAFKGRRNDRANSIIPGNGRVNKKPKTAHDWD